MLTEKQIEFARKMRMDGKTDEDIMSLTGLSKSSIRKYCSDIPCNVKKPEGYHLGNIHEDTKLPSIRKMWSEGYTPGYIASKLQMMPTTVVSIIKSLEKRGSSIDTYTRSIAMELQEQFGGYLRKVRENEIAAQEINKSARYWDDGTGDIIEGYGKNVIKKAHA